MRKLDSSNVLITGVLFGALMLGGCQSNEPAPEPAAAPGPTHATISNEFNATAAVVAVDAKSRVVTLRHEDGSLMPIKCGDAVQNFAQIAAGDTLHIKYTETLDANLLPAGESVESATAAVGMVGSEPGTAPAGGLGATLSVRVKVESIDVEHDIVVFSFASGELSARRVVTPEGRAFVKGLKVGDTVQLDYTEVLALAIEKV